MKETVIFSWILALLITIYVIISEGRTKKKEKSRRAKKQVLMNDLIDCKRDLTEEQILWRKYGKGIQYDNISHLKKRIRSIQIKLKDFEKK